MYAGIQNEDVCVCGGGGEFYSTWLYYDTQYTPPSPDPSPIPPPPPIPTLNDSGGHKKINTHRPSARLHA